MNKDNDFGYSLDIDDILAEFLEPESSNQTEAVTPAQKPAPAPQHTQPATPARPAVAKQEPFEFPETQASVPASDKSAGVDPLSLSMDDFFAPPAKTAGQPGKPVPAAAKPAEAPADIKKPATAPAEEPLKAKNAAPATEKPAEAPESVIKPELKPAENPASAKKAVPAEPEKTARVSKSPVKTAEAPASKPAEKTVSEKAGKKAASEKPAPKRPVPGETESAAEDDAQEKDNRYKVSLNGTRVLAAFLCFALTVACLFWLPSHVYTETPEKNELTNMQRLNLSGKLEAFANNLVSDSLGSFDDAKYIKKIYRIDESATAAPAPNPACFGSTTDPYEVQAVVESAATLLDGQTLSWNPEIDFFPNSKIRYYYDETILMIAWKEIINGKCCTFGEIKVADGSQIRRKLADDSYGSGVQLYPTTMANQVNAVIAINGDFYAFRDHGITTYQRRVYRCKAWDLDSCFFTADGDMLFSHAGELTTKEEAQAFVDANDVIFGVAFGPILVEDGELKHCDEYLIGEINNTYSRSAIGMIDELHYFIMTINYDDGCDVTATVNQEAQFMYDKGCIKAYALDGGQTATIVIQGETYNRVDWNCERTMSDIIYFASALPEGGN